MTVIPPVRAQILRMRADHLTAHEISAQLCVPITEVRAVIATPAAMPAVRAASRDARLDHLLAEGARSPRQGTRTLTERVRVQVEALRDRLAHEARQAELTERVGELAQALRTAQNELRAAMSTPAPNPRRADHA